MQINILQPKTKLRQKKRIGRGGKRGTFSGRGTKGLLARAGGKRRPEERDTLKRIPKLRGYRFKSFQARPVVINFDMLEAKMKPGDLISPETLLKAGMIQKKKGRMPKVKILGRGELKEKFVFKGVLFSLQAAKKLNIDVKAAIPKAK
ncbi:MAG: uL15 family ribosomal protein [Candidatus Sungbacteria bacterium]|nr:uL15 family ribosomal protein [Candidatus Sungbacteria bacterium]